VSIGADAGLPVERSHVAEGIDAYAPAAWAAALDEVIDRVQPGAVVAAGTERGNEVLAHVGARRDLPFAANCTAIGASSGGSLDVTRVRWGGSLLEEARIHSPLPLLSVAPHAVAAAEGAGSPEVETFTPALAEADLVVQVIEHVDEVVVVDDHITGVLSEHQAGRYLDIAPTGTRVKGRRSTPGRYFNVANPGTGWGGTDIEDPLTILDAFDPAVARPGLTLLMIGTTGEHHAYFVLDDDLRPVAALLPDDLRLSVERIRENCEPATTSVLFMAGAGGSLRAGATVNPVALTRSVGRTLTRVTCGGAPVYVWPGGGITFHLWAPYGKLDPAWRQVLLAFPDRFMVGTDTFTPERWHYVPGHAEWSRAWLSRSRGRRRPSSRWSSCRASTGYPIGCGPASSRRSATRSPST